MARRPDAPHPEPTKSDREKIVDAFMALLAERPFEEIGFRDIAARSGVALARCRAEFDSLLAVLAAQMEAIDRKVLEGGEPDLEQEPPRERLFDVLMRRLEALAPHKAAVRSLVRSARCNPPLALALNGLAVRSQQWMLTAAGISSSGLRGLIRAQGLACLYANVMRTWLDDEDPGLARTMAALDRELSRGARWSRFLDDLRRCVPNPCRRDRWRSRYEDRRSSDPGEQPAVV
jgi:AcrR family transcriptional regulator